MPVTNDSGLTFGANLSNPVPSGTLLEPVGSSLGLSTNLGGSPGTVFPTERSNPTFWRYSIGIERELPGDIVVELSYLGQTGQRPAAGRAAQLRARGSSGRRARSATTRPRRSSRRRWPTRSRACSPTTPAPAAARSPAAACSSPYPHFDTLSDRDLPRHQPLPWRAGALRQALHQRADDDVDLHVVADFREKVAPLNPWEDLEDRVGPVDRPHRVTLASVAELPFGQGRAIGNDWGGFTNAVLGGWQLSGKFEWQTGQPLTWGNVYYDPGAATRGADEPLGHARTARSSASTCRSSTPSCFYTRDGQPFGNAAGQPITFGAPEISLGAANIRTLPDARCPTSASRTITCWTWASRRTSSSAAASGCRCGSRRSTRRTTRSSTPAT